MRPKLAGADVHADCAGDPDGEREQGERGLREGAHLGARMGCHTAGQGGHLEDPVSGSSHTLRRLQP